VLKDAAAAKGEDKAALLQVAHSPLVFPTQADYAKLYRYRTLDNQELQTWNSIFEPVYQS
jgi:spermidine/putrescine transport system substrate-binding protein